MRKRLVITSHLVILSVFCLNAQVSSSWMSPSKTYFKIPIAKEGLYKIDYSLLRSNQFPVSDIDPRNIKIFHRGVEASIYVRGQNDAKFDTDDYIEFYAKGNDGGLDKYLYSIQDAQPHQYYNLFSDTTAYFLTWGYGMDRGKRIATENENNVSNLPKEESLILENLMVTKNEYSRGNSIQGIFTSSRFVQGEGFTGTRIRQGRNLDYSMQIGYPASINEKGTIDILIIGRNYEYHDFEIRIGKSATSLRQAETNSMLGYQYKKISLEISPEDINNDGEIVVRVNNLDNGRANQISVSYIRSRLPISTDISENEITKFHIKSNTNNKSYLELSGLPSDQEFYDITDSHHPVKIELSLSAGTYSGIINNTQDERIIFAPQNREIPDRIYKVEPAEYQISDNTFLIISNKKLMAPGNNMSNPVQAYADYRASVAGGGFNVAVADIDQLYNQFSYGEKTPLAIFRFIDSFKESGLVKNILLIGKGLDTSLNPERNSSSLTYEDLVPASGSPGSDIIYSAGLNSNSSVPAIPIGRITASVPTDVENYLDKVKLNESIQVAQPWRKNILHLSGGATEDELTKLREYLDNYASIATNSPIGASVETFQKKSTKDSEFVNIKDVINNGISLVTFFGHSASNILDIDVGFASNSALDYHNYGKYPVFLMNGCNAGSIYYNSLIQSEDWILARDKGSIAVFALSNLGVEAYLNEYSKLFYQLAFENKDFLTKGLGDIQKEIIKRDEEKFGTSLYNSTHLEQMSLLGDPAVKLFPFSQPDFTITNNSITINKDQPIDNNSNLNVDFGLENNGILINEPLEVIIKRTIPDGTAEYDGPFYFENLLSTNSISLELPNTESKYCGSNKLEIIIDPEDQIPEISELNNTFTIEFLVKANVPNNVFPYPYAFLSNTKIKFSGVSDKPEVFIDYDTNPEFLSKSSLGTSTQYNTFSEVPDLGSYSENTFYWQTSSNALDYTSVNSFTLNDGDSIGWTQRKTDQFLQNEFDGLKFIPGNQSYEWNKNSLLITVKTYGGNYEGYPEDVILQFNDEPYIYSSRLCATNTLNLIAFDHNSLVPYGPDYVNNIMCGRTPQVVNSFSNSKITNNPELLTDALEKVGSRDYLLVFSIGSLDFTNWSAGIKDQLLQFGLDGTSFSQLTNGSAFIFVGQKNETKKKQINAPADSTLDFSITLQNEGSEGTIKSPWIGPAKNWNNFLFKVNTEPGSSYDFDIIVKDNNQNELIYESGISNPESLSAIDAGIFPYMRLKFHTAGIVPAELKSWTLLYEPQPEGYLYYIDNDKKKEPGFQINEGDTLRSEFALVNLSNISFPDVMQIDFTQTLASGEKQSEDSILINPESPESDIEHFTITSPTRGWIGFNDLEVRINNPHFLTGNSQYQIVHLPNYFNVIQDFLNPVLDVKIDGRHISEGEIVSASPVISIDYWDANDYILQNETDAFAIEFGRQCDTCQINWVDNISDKITFENADPGSLKLLFKPGPLDAGIYILRINCKDGTGNYSGKDQYSIHFEISDDNIIKIFPAPNPFQNRLIFFVNIEGRTPPRDLLLSIWNEKGQFLAKINLSDIEEIKVGENRIEIPWNFHAIPGIYMYRIYCSDSLKWKIVSNADGNGDRGILVFSK